MSAAAPGATTRPQGRFLRELFICIGIGIAVLGGARGSDGHVIGPRNPRSRWPDGQGPFNPAASEVGWPAYLLAVLIPLAVALRHRNPRTAFVAVCVLTAGYLYFGGPMLPALIAPAVCVHGLALRFPPRLWVPLVPLLVPVLWAKSWRQPMLGLDDPALYLGIVLSVAAIVLPGLVGLLRADRRGAEVRRRDQELRQVAYEERLALARDIHDVVGHSLSMISLQSAVALRLLDKDPDQSRSSLEAIRDASRQSLAELRRTLGVFRESAEGLLAPIPDLAGIQTLADQLRTAGRRAEIDVEPGLSEQVPASVQQAAYRIVQEALTNVVRHAPDASVDVRLRTLGDALLLTVVDDGPTTAPPQEGSGLRGIRERVAALGGTVAIEPRTAAGTAHGLSIRVLLPLHGTPLPGEDL